MNAAKKKRVVIFIILNVILLGTFSVALFLWFNTFMEFYCFNPLFWTCAVVGGFLESEGTQWVRKSKRSGTTDLLFMIFMFLVMYLVTQSVFTGLLGTFSVYLVFAISELKEHKVINKVVLISAITYNVLFVSSLVDFFIEKLFLVNPGVLDVMFSVSLWLILALGFVIFGRRYIIVWRFMSPQYITLALYLLAWLLVATLASLFNFDMFGAIYPVLLAMIVVIYFTSGTLIDKFLGVKSLAKIDEKKRALLVSLVDDVKKKIGYNTKVRIGYGNYPIINAMAYGSIIDKRICIIAPEEIELPVDELSAIIAHELGHLKLHHPLYLMGINAIDLIIRWVFNIPATYYDFAFGRKFVLFGVDVGILGFIILNMLIYAFLYLFVRVMESHADFVVKRAGLGRELAKALYNLESFYALGRQVGLNVMLLADEKIDDEHRMLDYIEAARALRGQLVNPSRSLVVSTLLNSHPPSFLRIANAVLPDAIELSAWESTLILAKFTRKKNVIKFRERMEGILPELDTITRGKFLDEFGSQIDGNLQKFLEKLMLHGQKPRLLNNQALFTHKLTEEARHVQVTGIRYNDSIANPYTYQAIPVNGVGQWNASQGQATIQEMDPAPYKYEVVNTGEHYKIGESERAVLESIQQEGNGKKVTCTVRDEKGNEIKTDFKKIKNQVTPEFIMSLRNKDVFIEHNEAFDIASCKKTSEALQLREVALELEKANGITVTYKAGDLIFDTDVILIQFHQDNAYQERYVELFKWIMKTGTWMRLFLKKPVNSDYYCQVIQVTTDDDTTGDNGKHTGFTIVARDAFGKEIPMTKKDIDYGSFETDSAAIKRKDESSAIQKLLVKFLKRRHNVLWIPE